MNNQPISPRGASPSFAMNPPPLPVFLRHQAVPQNAGFAHSPPHMHMPLSPQKPSSDYLLHLVPQPQPSRNFSFHAQPPHPPHGEPIPPTFHPHQQRQFLERAPHQQENRQLRSSTEKHSPRLAMSNPNAFSQVRSKNFSEFNPRFNSQIEGREGAVSDYLQPRSPRQVANMEQVRRVSQYKEVSDKKSQRSSSQHNIHITIQSSLEGEQAPTITISPNGKNKQVETGLSSQQGVPSNGLMQRQVNFMPQSIAVSPRPANITQTIISQQAPMHHQPVIVNQPPTIISHHHPVFIQPHQSPPFPLQSQTKELSHQQNTLPSYSQLPMHNQIINDTLIRDRIPSISIVENKQQRAKKHSIQTMARQEYYNQLAQRDGEDESEAGQNGCENRTTGFSAYISDERMMFNTRRLIDQIFENETNRALLQMRVLEASSREKVVKRSGSRHYKKTAL